MAESGARAPRAPGPGPGQVQQVGGRVEEAVELPEGCRRRFADPGAGYHPIGTEEPEGRLRRLELLPALADRAPTDLRLVACERRLAQPRLQGTADLPAEREYRLAVIFP